MYDDFKITAFIPARGGSKGIPKKNLQILGDRPLIQWPLDFAKNANIFDQIVVSSDNDEILKLAENLGASLHIRPSFLSQDSSLVIDAIRHYLKTSVSHSQIILVVLECTSPFRKFFYLEKALELLTRYEYDSVATFNKLHVPKERIWCLNKSGLPETINPGVNPWLPRQELNPAYVLNGSIYAFKANLLPNTAPSLLFGKLGAVVLDSEDIVDIDDPRDLRIANILVEEGLVDYD